MKVYGEKVKQARRLKNLSQLELSKGLCTQATISNIEKHNECDSLEIFSTVCLRLDLEITQCIYETNEQIRDSLLTNVENLCNLLKYEEAYQLIKDVDYRLDENDLMYSKFYYYKGITILMGTENKGDCLHYLYLVQSSKKETKSKISIYYVLSINALGIYYQLNQQIDKAKVYFDKSMELLDKLTFNHNSYPRDFYKIFYNSAKFYSDIKKYKQSVSLCLKGIELNKLNTATHFLEYLYYELAFNKNQLKQESTEDYQTAFIFAKYHQNTLSMDTIIQDMKQFNLSFELVN